METRLGSKQHHSQALNYLKRLTFSGIKNERQCTDMEALTPAHARILEYILKSGPSYQGEHQDGHTSSFLADTVDGEGWAGQVLTTRLTTQEQNNSMDYNTFYGMLVFCFDPS